MDTENKIKKKILNRIEKIPKNRLHEVLQFLKKIEGNSQKKKKILSYAGIWSDMEEEEFNDMINDLLSRRKSRENRF